MLTISDFDETLLCDPHLIEMENLKIETSFDPTVQEL